MDGEYVSCLAVIFRGGGLVSEEICNGARVIYFGVIDRFHGLDGTTGSYFLEKSSISLKIGKIEDHSSTPTSKRLLLDEIADCSSSLRRKESLEGVNFPP